MKPPTLFGTTKNERTIARNPWTRRFLLIACVMFLVAGFKQPDKRGIYFSVAVVFGILAAQQRRGLVR